MIGCAISRARGHQLNEVVLEELEAVPDDQPRLRNLFRASDLPLPRASPTDKPRVTELRTVEPFEARRVKEKKPDRHGFWGYIQTSPGAL